MKRKDFYKAAAYLRLSRDDHVSGRNGDARGIESDSIRSQRDLIRSFVKSRTDMELYDVYADDGYSGTNFDRPAFKRMMEDVKSGKVDCIIVKDLSRFGRDYIEAGRLIQKTFPAFHIRFIAITDHFDSLLADYNEASLVLPIKNFINDSYCRDISLKVRSHQRIKRENGEFIGAFAVYGYRKEENNKNKLAPDEYAAGIVRNIFMWRLDGMSAFSIADKLNETGVLSPMEYKKSKEEKFSTGFRTGIKTYWSATAVKRILVNETYIGTLVQGKSEKVNYKVGSLRSKPEEEWVKVKNAHEAIVSRKDFYNVQKLLLVDSRARKEERKAHIFSGLLFCADCGEPMIRRVNRYKGKKTVCFICRTRNKGLGCTRHNILEEDLKQTILAGLRHQAALFIEKDKVREKTGGMEVQFEELALFENEIARLSKEQEQYRTLRAGLYTDWKEGVITGEDFESFGAIFEERYSHILSAIEKQKEMLRRRFQSGQAAEVKLEHIKELPELTEINRDVLLAFAEKIYVYEDKRILLQLKCREPFGDYSMPVRHEWKKARKMEREA